MLLASTYRRPRPRAGIAFARGVVRGTAQLLSRRDVELLGFVGDQYAVRLDQLAVWLGRGERTAQRVTRRLADAGLVEARALLAGEPVWLWLTRAGARASGTRFAGWSPRLGLLAHLEAVTWVRLYIAARSPHATWVGERPLLTQRATQAEHVPNGVVLRAGESHAVEVELTVKSRQRTERILDELSRGHDAVVYFTTPVTRAHLERLGGQTRWPRLALRDLAECVAQVRA